jgi:hypothetical protein
MATRYQHCLEPSCTVPMTCVAIIRLRINRAGPMYLFSLVIYPQGPKIHILTLRMQTASYTQYSNLSRIISAPISGMSWIAFPTNGILDGDDLRCGRKARPTRTQLATNLKHSHIFLFCPEVFLLPFFQDSYLIVSIPLCQPSQTRIHLTWNRICVHPTTSHCDFNHKSHLLLPLVNCISGPQLGVYQFRISSP